MSKVKKKEKQTAIGILGDAPHLKSRLHCSSDSNPGRNRSRRNVSSNRYSGRDFGSSSSRNARGKEVVGEMPLENIGGEIQEDEVEWLSDEELDEEHGVACDCDDEDCDDIIESRIQDLDSD
ncbi:hypothetical protein QJS10_CPA01g01903 [Acorus calamus]|uniref:Uncharacterized protein n=1 Tax=Acorus calamus TaxID=4465 RepID=A0AAV9FLW3_ACOCL|nr:hypothetical protein QJS10_CPA01g01903 [Acorus calamus]